MQASATVLMFDCVLHPRPAASSLLRGDYAIRDAAVDGLAAAMWDEIREGKRRSRSKRNACGDGREKESRTVERDLKL